MKYIMILYHDTIQAQYHNTSGAHYVSHNASSYADTLRYAQSCTETRIPSKLYHLSLVLVAFTLYQERA